MEIKVPQFMLPMVFRIADTDGNILSSLVIATIGQDFMSTPVEIDGCEVIANEPLLRVRRTAPLELPAFNSDGQVVGTVTLPCDPAVEHLVSSADYQYWRLFPIVEATPEGLQVDRTRSFLLPKKPR